MTTHYDALKSYAATTPGVVAAAFMVSPETFVPTYRLIYGSPGASLALSAPSARENTKCAESFLHSWMFFQQNRRKFFLSTAWI